MLSSSEGEATNSASRTSGRAMICRSFSRSCARSRSRAWSRFPAREASGPTRPSLQRMNSWNGKSGVRRAKKPEGVIAGTEPIGLVLRSSDFAMSSVGTPRGFDGSFYMLSGWRMSRSALRTMAEGRDPLRPRLREGLNRRRGARGRWPRADNRRPRAGCLVRGCPDARSQARSSPVWRVREPPR